MKKRRYILAQETFKLRYTGEAVNDGTMDAKEFATSLLGAIEIFQIVADSVNIPKNQQPAIRLTEVNEGSFEAVLQMVTDLGLFERFVTALNDESITAVTNLKDLVDLALGALALTTQIGGRDVQGIEDVPDSPNEKVINFKDGTNIVAQNGSVVNVVINNNYQQAAQRFTSPLQYEGVESLSVEDENGQQQFVVDKSEVESFKTFKTPPENLEQNDRETYIEIVRPVLDGSKQKWNVQDGDSKFNVDMLDESFIEKVINKDVSFRSNETFKVLMREEQFMQNRSLKSKKSILKVLAVQNPNGGFTSI